MNSNYCLVYTDAKTSSTSLDCISADESEQLCSSEGNSEQEDWMNDQDMMDETDNVYLSAKHDQSIILLNEQKKIQSLILSIIQEK